MSSGEVHVLCDVDDHEILRLEAALKPLQTLQGQRVDLEGFRQEIIGRFEEQGFVVRPNVHETDQDDTFWFDVVVIGRTEPKHYDPDRQVFDVTRDTLGLGDEGVLKATPLQLPHKHKH